MKIKYFKTPVVFLVIVILLCGQEGNSKAAIKGIKNYAVQDDTAGLIQHLSTLIQNSDNTLFTNHCNSIINVFRKEEQITNYEAAFIKNMFSTFTDTTISWNASKLSSYLERKRPFIISWISPVDSVVSVAWLIPPLNWEPGKTYPLYVSLHGLYNSYYNRIEYMSTYFSPNEILDNSFDDGYSVYPWARGNLWYEGISETDVLEAVNEVELLVKIDSSKKYLIGHSMGGYGVWMIGQKYPEKWAALGIYAGCWWDFRSKYLNNSIAEKLKDVPVYIVCGTNDGYLSDNNKAYTLLHTAGNPNIFFTSFPGGHDPLLENWQAMYGWIKQWTKQNNTAVVGDELKLNMYLYNNFPNPFNPATTISYSLSSSVHVQLSVLDILGREVKLLIDKEQNTGRYEVKFDGSNLSSGVYFYRMKAGEFSETKKFLLLK